MHYQLSPKGIYPMSMLPKEGSVFVHIQRSTTTEVRYLPVSLIQQYTGNEADQFLGWSTGVETVVECRTGIGGVADILRPLQEHLEDLRATNHPVALQLTKAISYLMETPYYQLEALGVRSHDALVIKQTLEVLQPEE